MKRILYIEHNWGGGLSRHVQDLASFLKVESIEGLRCRPTRNAWLDLELINCPSKRPPIRIFLDDIEQCVATIRNLNIIHAHFHSIIGYSAAVVDQLLRAFRQAKLQYDFTIHDYALVCPRLHMVDFGLIYCDVASLQYCDRCVSAAGTPFGDVDPAGWREGYLTLLQGARSIFVPNTDVAERIRRVLGAELRLKVKPHPEPISTVSSQSVRRSSSGPRRVALIGRLTEIKGLHVIRAMALDAANRRLSMRFIIFGEPGDLEPFSNVEVRGAFQERDIDDIVQSNPTDMAFFPSVCPETHLYTLSIAFRNLLFPVVFDIGSQAERVRRSKFGAVIPLDMALTPHRLNDYLMAMETPSISACELNTRAPIAAWSSAREYYELDRL